MSRLKTIPTGLTLACLLVATSARGQMLQTTVPFQQLSDSYSSGFGTSWGLQGPGWQFNFPGGGLATPALGANPNAGFAGGIAGSNGKVSGQLRFGGYQSSTRSNVVTVPSLTTTSGYPGSIQSGVVRPFVTGITPLVGFRNPNDQMRDAMAHRQTAQLSSIAKRKMEARQEKVEQYLKRAQQAADRGDLKTARANYRLALGKASGPLRNNILQQMAHYGLGSR